MSVHQRARRDHFAHRHRVHPDRVVQVELAVEPGVALGPPLQVLALAHAAPDEMVERDREGEPQDQRVQAQ